MQRYKTTIFQGGFVILTLALLLFGSAPQGHAQRVVLIEPGVGTINEAILGDTTATGERVDLNTIYELQPGGVYLATGSIETRFPLHVRAAEGEGARPAVVPAVGEGGESSRPFTPRDDITLEGLYITNRDELGGFNTRIVRVRADSARVTIDNCHLDFDAQSGMRLDNEYNVIKITNSVISNIGRASSLNNGRGIDTRGNPVDTLIYENNTFYNITSRIVRDDGAYIRYAKIDKNTIYNVAQHGVGLGQVQEAIITNNLWINPGFLGQSDSTFNERSIIDFDSLTTELATGPQTVTIANNYFYTDPALLAAQPDSVHKVRLADPLSPAAEVIAADPTNVEVEGTIDFVESIAVGATGDVAAVPAAPTDLVEQFWTVFTASLPEDDLPDMDDGGADAFENQLPFEFRYAETEDAYTAADDGLPLGDRNWFDLVGVAVEETAEVPASHRLVGNYPNPFNPSTTIKFELASNAEVTVDVFDIAGRKLMSLPAGAMAAGSAEVTIDAIDAPSGTYMYRVMIETGADTKVLSGTMTLLK